MNTKRMLNILAKRFPKRIAKDNHDFVGLMCGKLPENVNKVLLCLDFDWELLPLAKSIKPDMIITHHPFVFGPKSKILKYDESKRNLYQEIENMGIAIYSFHTNFDAGRGGMNDTLAEKLGLKNIYAPVKNPMMRIGELENPMDVEEFAKFAKEQFDVEYSLLINYGANKISKVGIIGGGGSRSWPLAKDEGCDIYISGDAPHYVRRDVVNAKYNYLDMPHEIEKAFMPKMEKLLLDIDSELEIVTIDHEKLPKVI